MSVVPLRDLFEQLVRDPSMRAELAAGPSEYFAARGYPDLDGPLVAEALTNVAAGFPPDVAEHFSEYTAAASPVPSGPEAVGFEAGRAFELLASAPDWPDVDPVVADEPISPAALDPEAPDAFGAGADIGADHLEGSEIAAETGVADDLDDAETRIADDVDDPEAVTESAVVGADPLDDLDLDPVGGEAEEAASLAVDEPEGPADADEIDGDVVDG